MPRRLMSVLLVSSVLALAVPPFVVATAADAAAISATTPGPPSTDNDFVPTRDLDDCISALPQPDCGSSSRSGWRQWVVFALLVVAIAFIAWRIVRSARRGRTGGTTDDP